MQLSMTLLACRRCSIYPPFGIRVIIAIVTVLQEKRLQFSAPICEDAIELSAPIYHIPIINIIAIFLFFYSFLIKIYYLKIELFTRKLRIIKA